jgi:hypothetical protein
MFPERKKDCFLRKKKEKNPPEVEQEEEVEDFCRAEFRFSPSNVYRVWVLESDGSIRDGLRELQLNFSQLSLFLELNYSWALFEGKKNVASRGTDSMALRCAPPK